MDASDKPECPSPSFMSAGCSSSPGVCSSTSTTSVPASPAWSGNPIRAKQESRGVDDEGRPSFNQKDFVHVSSSLSLSDRGSPACQRLVVEELVLDRKAGPEQPSRLAKGSPYAVKLEDRYDVGEKLGFGAQSVVYAGTDKTSGEKVAIKVVDKRRMSESNLKSLQREIVIQRQLSHPNIVRLIDVFYTQTKVAIVTEFMAGGDVFQKISRQDRLPEDEARVVFGQLAQAVSYLQARGIAHRDIKPENLLLADSAGLRVKLCDFGFAIDSNTDVLSQYCGTLNYVAPEVLSQKTEYTTKCDVWSLGVLLYVVLSGYMPFYGSTANKCIDRTLRGKYYPLTSTCFAHVSDCAKDMISRLLIVDPERRMTISQCLAHPWLSTQSTRL
eukprot:m51a1_g2888 putative protein kinase domain containing protein (385) ;mRNA; r:420569-422354